MSKSTTHSTKINEPNKQANFGTALFASIVYVYLVSSLVSWWFFLVPNDFLPPDVAQAKLYSMEQASKTNSVAEAAFYNIGLIFLFGFFHSLLARKTIKKWMNLPVSIERPIFCLQSAFFLHMMQHYWKDMEGWNIWDVSDSPMVASSYLAGFWFGAAYLLSATFALDHFHLFGLSQGFGMDLNAAVGLNLAISETKKAGLATRWHYKHVAHPIMTGMLLTFWMTPVMSPARLVCAMFMSLYVFVAVLCFEERSIRNELGSEYDEYLANTPRFFPKLMPESVHVHIKKHV